MPLTSWLKYHAMTMLAGPALLRVQRFRSYLRRRRRPPDPDSPLGPRLASASRLRELMFGHYLEGRYVHGVHPVAWVTSGAPVELLRALGYFVLYPENHAAICAAQHKAGDLCAHAEGAGYSMDLCSYARTDIGSVLSGQSPVGKLPRPDLLVACTNICQTVLQWYRALAEHLKTPLAVVDTPFLFEQEPGEHQIDYVAQQLQELAEAAARVAGRRFELASLKKVLALSKEATLLWGEILDQNRRRPAPLTAFDQFVHLAPIVSLRGLPECVHYYRHLLAECRRRADHGVGAVKEERVRLVWDNLPIWFNLRKMSHQLASRGFGLVAATYTNAWAECAPLIDPAEPVRSGARVYSSVILNRGLGHRKNALLRMCKDFSASGVLFHSDRSCKPYSLGQYLLKDELEKEGIRGLVLEADHSDPRVFAQEQITARLEAFMESFD